MTAQESKILRIQLYHPFMGVQNFDISSRQNFTDLRTMLSQHTQMTIFENYRFEANGKLLMEFQEIGQVIQNETRINLVIQPFDQRSSCYHLERVKDVLANPIQWIMLNSRQSCQQKQLPTQKLPENVSIDNFLDNTLSSPLYEHDINTDKSISFLQHLNFSIHNPAPMYRKLAGDFYYLQVKTLEGRQEHVTACPLGFYINNSTNSVFSTNNQTGVTFYNLLDLFKYLSPKFKQNFNSLKKIFKIGQLDRAIFSSFRSPPLCQWLKNTSQLQKKAKYNQWKYFKSQMQNDSSIIKDWGQILQLNLVSPSDSQSEACSKQKNQYKLYQDFVQFAKQLAIKVVQNHINSRQRLFNKAKKMFTHGSVCVWFAEDNLLSYALKDNQKMTRRAVNAEIRNLEILQNGNKPNIGFKHLVIVNYRGWDVVVETIVPGYNSVDSKNSCNVDFQQKDKLIEQIAKLYRVQCNNLYKNDKNQVERAFIHPHLKYIKNGESRSYLLNLYSLSCRDLNFPTLKNEATYIRRQLIPIYNQKQNCYRNTNSMIETGYNLVGSDRINEQHMKMQSIKVFAEEIMVPLCIQSFLRANKKYLADSKTVVKVLHKFGLGSRYLGSIYKKADQYEASHIKTIIQRVILAKSLKNIFRQALKKAESGDIKSTICRLLNCIFFSQVVQNSMDESLYKQDFKDEISTNASRKKKKKVDYQIQGQQDLISIKITQNGNSHLKPLELWESIKQVVSYRYGVKFAAPKISMLKCLQNQFGKCALLRDICLSTGITLQKTEYFQKQGQTFKPQNIEQLKAKQKSIHLHNKHLQSLTQQGDLLLQRKRVEQAIDIYNQAINFATSNFGIMTQQLAILNRKVGQIYFRIGEVDAAIMFINCAQKMCEKIYGESHVDTLECYHLASQFYFFVRNFQTAEFYLIKAIHVSTVSFGEEYPELIIYYLNLSTVYETCLRFMDSITCISHALKIVLRVFGQNHINAAICYAAMSTAHFQIPDIQKSIYFQQKSLQIMRKILKEDDPRLKQGQKVLEYYHHLQVSKKVKQNYEKERKKFIANQQLYAGFPLFRVPQCSNKDRELIYRKMQSFMQFPGKFFV